MEKAENGNGKKNEIIKPNNKLLSLYGSLPPKGEQNPKEWDVIRREAREENIGKTSHKIVEGINYLKKIIFNLFIDALFPKV